MATSRTSGAAVPAGLQSRKAATATSEQFEQSYSSPKLPGEKSDTSPAVPAAVIYKLLAFTFAMVTLPISSYFMTVNTVFGGNSTYAGALAAIMANVVLFGYVFAAMKEDQADQLEEKKKMMSSRKAE